MMVRFLQKSFTVIVKKSLNQNLWQGSKYAPVLGTALN